MPPGEAFAGDFPGTGEVAGNFPREVVPETLPLWRGPQIVGRAHLGVVDVDMLRGVLRIGGGGQQEFSNPPFPSGTSMNQLVADHEDGLRFHGQNDRQDHVLPNGEWIGDQNLPQAENERRRPQERPSPDRQVVPEQAALRRLHRVHVAPVHAERPIELPGDAHEHYRRQQPPAALDQGDENQRKNDQRQIVGERVSDRRLDGRGDLSPVRA